ncbi:MAG: flagellar hook-associated protein FlgK [Gemmatimonadetes bacterium]|nr:flagellar hook-associated protein FlgK [Gemmatimonadota bacterium]MBT5056176.1 flagellar hook-associated protein FlgK [Gemmatimonadota bacterium]MBT5142574.1 flagellar hook-associated protein FlgK [Gemmatimonadota bacterium]MBT5592167.1 flagellar hook-associated protein FlgK [Gemmatimonadota bacterium]MBT5961129.1 flagellar hook-associated protein FlgK [Gemmatimonadota bacterium]
MTTLASGIEIGRRALQAQQTALQVTSHNIANANTPGFSQRTVELENVAGVPGGVGGGVNAASVTRERDQFLDAQMRVELQVLGRWQAMERALSGIEGIFNEPAGAGSSEAGTIFNEPSGLGLSGSLSRFWNAWQDLANVPESGAARAAVRQEADFMVTTLHQLDTQLADLRGSLDQEVIAQVDEINSILDSLAAINGEIPRSGFDGGTGGDLLDQRDRLLEDLSERVDISVLEKDNGQITVLLSGHSLVQQNQAVHLDSRTINQNDLATSTIFFSDDGSLVPIREGALRGLMESRDLTIPDFQSRLDTVAVTMVEEVNRLHRSGTGTTGSSGVDFFDNAKLTASNIAVDDRIIADLNNISASGDGNAGDNGVALGIAGLRNDDSLAGLGGDTVEGFFFTLIGEVGARSKEAQTMAGNHRLFSSQIENRRQSVQGVSLNDEASKLVLFQRAYQAAARTVSIIDDLMEVTINL